MKHVVRNVVASAVKNLSILVFLIISGIFFKKTVVYLMMEVDVEVLLTT